MLIELGDIQAETLALSLPTDPPLQLKLRELHQGSGSIAIQGGVTHLQRILMQQTLLEIVSLMVGDIALSASAPLALTKAAIDMTFAERPTGSCSAATLETKNLSFAQSKASGTLDVALGQLQVEIDKTSGKVLVDSLTLANMQASFGQIAFSMKRCVLSKVTLHWSSEGVQVSVGQILCSELDLRMPSKQVSIAEIELDTGLVFDRGTLHFEKADLSAIALSLDELSRVRSSEEAEATAHVAAKEIRSSPLSWSSEFLDGISGFAHVDLGVHATLPVIGKREAVHRFRVPVDSGVINFKTLEEGLSDLENAFIDFNHRGERLVLERDIPLIPGFEKPLIFWELSGEDVARAKKNEVRLQVLAHPNLVESKPKDEKKESKLKLHRLDLDKIKVRLSAAPGVVLKSSEGASELTFEGLEVIGRLIQDRDPNVRAQATTLTAACSALSLSMESFSIAAMKIVSGRADLVKLEPSDISFLGLTPVKLATRAQSVTLNDVKIKL